MRRSDSLNRVEGPIKLRLRGETIMRGMFTHRAALAAVVVSAIALFGASTASAVEVGNSVTEFSGVQGTNNWSYGYHNETANSPYDAADFIPFSSSAAPVSDFGFHVPSNKWDWFNAAGNANAGGASNPPWTEITQNGGHPNGTNNTTEQWAVRRWTSTVNGGVNIDLQVAKTNPNGTGVTAHAFVNGMPEAVIPIAGNDTTGRTWSVHIPNLSIGDVVDIALDPTGPSGDSSDGSDGSNFSGVIDLVAERGSTLIADSAADFSGVQGQDNWFNGYHNLSANGAYDASPGGTDDFIEFGPGGDPGFTFNGTNWDWMGGAVNPPWTVVGQTLGHPNTSAAGTFGNQWAVRRYIAEQGGDMFVEAFLAAQNVNGGDGTVLHLFHNGVELGTLSIGGTDAVGLRDVFSVPGVSPGDFIDIALDYGGNDGSDGSFFGAQVFVANQVPEPATAGLAIMAVAGLGLRRRRRQA